MKTWILGISAVIAFSGCGHIYIVRNAQLTEIVVAPNDHQRKRVIITGWARDGFEASSVYSTREEALTGEGVRIEVPPSSWPWDTTDPFRFTTPYAYNVAKVQVEGTVLFQKSIRPSPLMIDCIIVALSPVEKITAE